MNRLIVALALALFLLPGAPLPSAAQLDGPGPYIGTRSFVLVMEGNRFNFAEAPETPVLEAYIGERIRFLIVVPPNAESHTFHLHGHPWDDPVTGETVDAIRLDPGRFDNFEMVAGLNDVNNAGDWFYHCHVEDHFMNGMWGLLRLYPYGMDIAPNGRTLDVTVHQIGEPLDGATLRLTMDDSDIPVPVEPRGDGRYRVGPIPATVLGAAVLHAEHSAGKSLARLQVAPGGIEVVRDVAPPPAVLDDLLADDPVPRTVTSHVH